MKPGVNWFRQWILKILPTRPSTQTNHINLYNLYSHYHGNQYKIFNFNKKINKISFETFITIWKNKKIKNFILLQKISQCKLDIFKNIFAYLFLTYPINSTQINTLFFGLVWFGFYQKNVQIQSKQIHIFLIDLSIRYSRNRTESTHEHSHMSSKA